MAKSAGRSNVDIINDLRQNYSMTYEDFSAVWRRYDEDGTTERVESCVRDMISMVNVPTMSPYKEAVCEVCLVRKYVMFTRWQPYFLSLERCLSSTTTMHQKERPPA